MIYSSELIEYYSINSLKKTLIPILGMAEFSPGLLFLIYLVSMI
ncbi:hypothetical protein SpAn4DRAFT_0027 [Sporomusa ovata]|uniref:Uncharacterized protein n=1 Tax=Sporomusa ovata TaxID=2378 RepID=A0A0U1L1Z5_9FIRM|nr:hypothetical protein SpAn4DRAFT_0027 [Sporomusa ovata]